MQHRKQNFFPQDLKLGENETLSLAFLVVSHSFKFLLENLKFSLEGARGPRTSSYKGPPQRQLPYKSFEVSTCYLKSQVLKYFINATA